MATKKKAKKKPAKKKAGSKKGVAKLKRITAKAKTIYKGGKSGKKWGTAMKEAAKKV